MQAHIQVRWGKETLYTASVKTTQSKQYQISVPKYLRMSEEYGVSDYMENLIFLGLSLTKIPLFLMFCNEIRFSRPFFYGNCYFCVTKWNLRSNLALGVAYSVIQSFPARIFSVPLSRRLTVKIWHVADFGTCIIFVLFMTLLDYGKLPTLETWQS